MFDPDKNAIVFGPHLSLSRNQSPGTKVKVNYTAATYSKTQ